MYRWLRRLLFAFDAETIHEWVLTTSAHLPRQLGYFTRIDDPTQVAGLTFPNRVGLAAGFDKNARWIGAAEALGFGHIEVGAVTPRPQPGHPRPRLFRLSEHQALRNRMGFNNDGLEAISQRLRSACSGSRKILVGVNLGKNADTPLDQAASDYQKVIDGCADCCDYYSLNVSSPNTEGLRNLDLARLIGQLRWTRPLFIKLSPDEDLASHALVAAQAKDWGVAGVVFSNTTLRRDPPLDQVDALGGISGRPLLARNLERLRQLQWSVPVIGVGGIFGPSEAVDYLRAGASLVQVYTGFVYAGPGLPRRVAAALKAEAASR